MMLRGYVAVAGLEKSVEFLHSMKGGFVPKAKINDINLCYEVDGEDERV